MIDMNEASQRISMMWKRIANNLEAVAIERSKSATTLDLAGIIKTAKTAEACRWQATGDRNPIDLEDL